MSMSREDADSLRESIDVLMELDNVVGSCRVIRGVLLRYDLPDLARAVKITSDIWLDLAVGKSLKEKIVKLVRHHLLHELRGRATKAMLNKHPVDEMCDEIINLFRDDKELWDVYRYDQDNAGGHVQRVLPEMRGNVIECVEAFRKVAFLYPVALTCKDKTIATNGIGGNKWPTVT